jgi:hypothetical protein
MVTHMHSNYCFECDYEDLTLLWGQVSSLNVHKTLVPQLFLAGGDDIRLCSVLTHDRRIRAMLAECLR